MYNLSSSEFGKEGALSCPRTSNHGCTESVSEIVDDNIESWVCSLCVSFLKASNEQVSHLKVTVNWYSVYFQDGDF